MEFNCSNIVYIFTENRIEIYGIRYRMIQIDILLNLVVSSHSMLLLIYWYTLVFLFIYRKNFTEISKNLAYRYRSKTILLNYQNNNVGFKLVARVNIKFIVI